MIHAPRTEQPVEITYQNGQLTLNLIIMPRKPLTKLQRANLRIRRLETCIRILKQHKTDLLDAAVKAPFYNQEYGKLLILDVAIGNLIEEQVKDPETPRVVLADTVNMYVQLEQEIEARPEHEKEECDFEVEPYEEDEVMPWE